MRVFVLSTASACWSPAFSTLSTDLRMFWRAASGIAGVCIGTIHRTRFCNLR